MPPSWSPLSGSHEQVAARLYEETDGLPLFIVEYLASFANSGLLDGGELPGGIRDLLRSRLTSVGGVALQLLTTAAAVGRPFDLDLVRVASGRSEDEALVALEELLERGLIYEASAGPTYDFRHKQARILVYAETSLARQRLLHRSVADALVQRDGANAPAAVLAYHYRQAGREVDAAVWLARAGDRARGLCANTEALEQFQAALALGHPDPAPLHEAIGDLQTLGGDYAAALTDAQRLSEVERKLGLLHHRRGAWELADSSFLAALAETSQDDHAARARLQADRSLTAHRADRTEQGLALAAEALALAEAAGDTDARAHTHTSSVSLPPAEVIWRPRASISSRASRSPRALGTRPPVLPRSQPHARPPGGMATWTGHASSPRPPSPTAPLRGTATARPRSITTSPICSTPSAAGRTPWPSSSRPPPDSPTSANPASCSLRSGSSPSGETQLSTGRRLSRHRVR